MFFNIKDISLLDLKNIVYENIDGFIEEVIEDESIVYKGEYYINIKGTNVNIFGRIYRIYDELEKEYIIDRVSYVFKYSDTDKILYEINESDIIVAILDFSGNNKELKFNIVNN
ncbi:hypothetical protein H8697_07365 [[Eubacterium] tenue]|nr:hypothetical protein [[Eubacterium] tenue]MBC8631525.1 hypothetical protein [[Eubacterium] tenue]